MFVHFCFFSIKVGVDTVSRVRTPRAVGDVADAVDVEQQVPGWQTEKVPDSVQQAVQLGKVKNPRDQEYRHQTAEIQRRDRREQSEFGR